MPADRADYDCLDRPYPRAWGNLRCHSHSGFKSILGSNAYCACDSIHSLNGLALLMVALAVLVRGAIGAYTGVQVFTTFYPAVIVAALVGGLWPGIFATVLSVIAAWYLVIPRFFAGPGEHELVEFVLFMFISGVDVAIAVLLSKLVERLVIQQRNIRLLLESAPNGLVLVDERGTIKLVNASAEKLFGYSRNELIGKDVETLVPEQHIAGHRKVRASYQKEPEVRLMGLGCDLSGQRKDGSAFPVEIGLNPIGQDGRPAVLATVIDISARKRAEEHQRLIIGELKHRTSNLLAVMQALIANTLKESKTVAEAAYVLNGRVISLSQAYSLFADSAWEGASLAKILKTQPILDSKRVTIEGCEVIVPPRAAQQFVMIIHELATNALKYGSLSSSDGRVSISGKLDRYNGSGSFVFLWTEHGGPRVAPPARRGFGSAILLDAAQQFGRVTVEYRPDGLIYQLQLDLSAIDIPTNGPTLLNTPSPRIKRVRFFQAHSEWVTPMSDPIGLHFGTMHLVGFGPQRQMLQRKRMSAFGVKSGRGRSAVVGDVKMRTLLCVTLLSTTMMRYADAQPAGLGNCYSAPYCQGTVLGHWDYVFCSRAGSSWRSDADGKCY